MFFEVVRALVPRMALDELFEQKGEVAKAVLEELEKVTKGACFYKLLGCFNDGEIVPLAVFFFILFEIVD